MSELSSKNTVDLLRTPGTLIELDNLRQLPDFEDIIAPVIDPTMSDKELYSWQGRVNITSSLRPASFVGTVSRAVLEVMDDPVERLFDAKQRGYSFGKLGGGPAVRPNRGDDTMQRWRNLGMGFTLHAQAKKNHKDAGQIRAELWYLPVAVRQIGSSKKTYSAKATQPNGGMSIKRWGTKPVYDTEPFVDECSGARRVGLVTLRSVML